ncbi:anthranilate phosphoribosyltransferase [Natronoflexus pectinivorans]|uniref:Anthranilate phosphoribosyltransferase n=1 Tax=Natronoflexus pectinivorans TaxID=682526 RepID=A0A4R2GMD6_9BACT|nr:anthranilate phosphoribosyltransferase [Natronoflexus pectinivorans]TCO10425.1 anthranilate phosphoribosyltransferase [Natronoflexus pectinivorans]
MLQPTLKTLFDYQTLSREEARQILVNIAGEVYSKSEVVAFLSVFMMRPVTVEELSGFRDALLELRLPVDLSGFDTIDLCGTGGDGKNTFNISTLASFVTAGAGVKVAKHGNYGVSSGCGSSNMLEYLGYKFTTDNDLLKRQLDEAGICFLHAPLFHPAMKAVAPIRRELGIKTFFNMLGPMVNPSNPGSQLIGVFDLELARIYQYIYQQGDKRFAIIHSIDGYDEVSLTAPFKVITQNGERLMTHADLKMKPNTPESISGGHEVDEAAKIFTKVLSGQGTEPQNNVVIANAGLAIHCMYPEKELDVCLDMAKESLLSGSAEKVLKRLLEVN